MQEPYGKAVATRAGLEPWRRGGNVVTQASVEDRAGWVLESGDSMLFNRLPWSPEPAGKETMANWRPQAGGFGPNGAPWARRVGDLLTGCVEIVACPVAAMCIFLHLSAFWAALRVLIGCGRPNAKKAECQECQMPNAKNAKGKMPNAKNAKNAKSQIPNLKFEEDPGVQGPHCCFPFRPSFDRF